jgi:hypothetical protein
MSGPSKQPSAKGTFFRVLVAGFVIALAIGFPAVGATSTLSQGELGVGTVMTAAAIAAVGAGISVLFMRTVVREVWTAWVGLLSGVTPTSLAAPRSQLIALALAYLAAGALLAANGLRLLADSVATAATTWAQFGLLSALTGVGLGLGGAVPRLWWAWRGASVEQPDDTVGRHLNLFAWLALSALALASGLAETLPARLDPAAGVPLRSGDWERECVSTNALVQDICPRERRYVLRTRSPRRMRLEWGFPGACEVAVDEGEGRRTFADGDAFIRLDVAPERPVTVTIIGLDIEGCRFELRAYPEPTGGG